METITIDQDIKVFYVTATSFPDGVMAAHQELHSRVPFSTDRRYFGISRPENGIIVYRAAAEEIKSGEAEKYDCDGLTLTKGNYASVTIHDYMNDLSNIGKTFQKILSDPNIDPEGYCVEWYLSQKDVRCMVRLKD